MYWGNSYGKKKEFQQTRKHKDIQAGWAKLGVSGFTCKNTPKKRVDQIKKVKQCVKIKREKEETRTRWRIIM